MRIAAVLAVAAAAVSLGACQQAFKAPLDQGVCYYVVPNKDDPDADPQVNVVARDVDNVDICALQLDAMRQRFLSMGGSNTSIIGAYQGRFIFISRSEAKYGSPGGKIDGVRYFGLARGPDGALVSPGAVVRDADGRPIAVVTPVEPVAAN